MKKNAYRIDWAAAVMVSLALLLTAWAVAWMFVQAWKNEPNVQVSDTQINIAIEAMEE